MEWFKLIGYTKALIVFFKKSALVKKGLPNGKLVMISNHYSPCMSILVSPSDGLSLTNLTTATHSGSSMEAYGFFVFMGLTLRSRWEMVEKNAGEQKSGGPSFRSKLQKKYLVKQAVVSACFNWMTPKWLRNGCFRWYLPKFHVENDPIFDGFLVEQFVGRFESCWGVSSTQAYLGSVSWWVETLATYKRWESVVDGKWVDPFAVMLLVSFCGCWYDVDRSCERSKFFYPFEMIHLSTCRKPIR